MEITHGWKVGSCIKINADKAAHELEAIGGEITPRQVVTYAEGHKRSELHKHFEWDNEKAGDLYRLQQARHILACIVIEKEISTPKGDKEIIIMRGYENVEIENEDDTEDKRFYVPTEVALSTPKLREQVLDGIEKTIFDLQVKAKTYGNYLKNPSKFSKGIETALQSI
jgi:hypothetical protein